MQVIFDDLLTGAFAPFSLNSYMIFIISILMYFVAEFKFSKSFQADFSWGYWIKDNKYNIAFSILAFALYNFASQQVEAMVLFLIGIGGNWLLDVYQTYRYYKTHPAK